MPDLTCFVTGAGSGIGEALVHALAARGHTVFAGVLPAQRAQAAADYAVVAGNPPHVVPVDVTDEASVDAAAAWVAGRTRYLDAVINVAGVIGITSAMPPAVFDYADIHHTFDVNAVGPLRVANALFPLLLGGRNRLVLNISSEAGSVGTCTRDAWYGYCMSKSALNMASALLHNRLRPLGGKVLVMHPGWVRTRMGGKLETRAPLSPQECAEAILVQFGRALADEAAFLGDRPAFVDWRGIPVPW